jgi:hypothetical protein
MVFNSLAKVIVLMEGLKLVEQVMLELNGLKY